MRLEYFFIGLTLLILCLAIANSLEEFFTFSDSVTDTLRVGFLVLGLGGFLTGIFKGLGD